MKKLKPLNQLKKGDINKIKKQNQKVHIKSNSCSTIETTNLSNDKKTYLLNKHLLSRRLLVRNKKRNLKRR